MKTRLISAFIISAFLFSLSVFGQKKDLSLQEIWASNTFNAAFVIGGDPMEDGSRYSMLEFGREGLRVSAFSYATGEKLEDIFRQEDIQLDGKPIDFDSYEFSPGETKLLVPTEKEYIYRHSTRSRYVIIDLKAKKAQYLAEGKQQYAEFSPQGDKIAYVRDNNLFVKDLQSGAETQITKDGKQNEIINGASDWVYEEEFAISKAFEWSPSGDKIAFLRFDESAVKEYNMQTYGSLYPGIYSFKYPKAGEDNSLVQVFVYDQKSGKTVKMKTGDDKNQYIPRIKWNASGSQLCITRLNRHQNHLELLMANPADGGISILLEEKSNTYIDINDNLFFLNDGKHFVWSSELGGRNHVYLYDMQGNKKNAVTSGDFDVTEVYGVNDKSGMLYYQAAFPSPSDRSIFKVKLNGKGNKQLNGGGGHFDGAFSADYSYYLLTSSKANEAERFDLCDANGKVIRNIESNSLLTETLANYNLSAKEFFSFTTERGDILNGWMIKPPGFDQNKKYPVFMTVYGGPGHNTVENRWEGRTLLWHYMLAQKGYIVVSVDNRGTQYRGEAFKKATYMQLGKLETEDQISTAVYLQGLPYVDKSRIGIQGWSYGGYMSSLCITKGADIFKMAIAIAPVTNWRYYDSIYTERFMQTPDENASGYDDNSPINHVARLKGAYLLVHGTGDDNVHFQNSVEMVNALVKANKQFDFFAYPDRNHGIYGGNTRLHLFTKMTDFILKNL
ncbi:MAG: S9 family peptidase [Bacteroidetes bacterium]|nr:S9 family peptidase [Bacteroidota bacterium]